MKVLVVELSHLEAQDLSRYKVQHMFNSSLNTLMKCPFCNRKIGLITSSNLIIGNTDQLNYNDIFSANSVKGDNETLMQGFI